MSTLQKQRGPACLRNGAAPREPTESIPIELCARLALGAGFLFWVARSECASASSPRRLIFPAPRLGVHLRSQGARLRKLFQRIARGRGSRGAGSSSSRGQVSCETCVRVSERRGYVTTAEAASRATSRLARPTEPRDFSIWRPRCLEYGRLPKSFHQLGEVQAQAQRHGPAAPFRGAKGDVLRRGCPFPNASNQVLPRVGLTLVLSAPDHFKSGLPPPAKSTEGHYTKRVQMNK
jgi:hypothetical protein